MDERPAKASFAASTSRAVSAKMDPKKVRSGRAPSARIMTVATSTLMVTHGRQASGTTCAEGIAEGGRQAERSC